jgi:mono/diheme cytochrome c family protein
MGCTMSFTTRPEWKLGLVVVLGLATAPLIAVAGGGQNKQQTKFVGSELFRTYCATCHGKSGKGDGPLADSLRKRPPDLTQFAKQNNDTFPAEKVRRIIDGREPVTGHGGPDMPVWGDAFAQSREDADPESVKLKIQAIVDFLQSIQQRPALSPSVH